MLKKRILFVVDNLKLGGVTKVLCNLLQELVRFDAEIDLMVLHYYEDMQIDLPKQVRILKGSSAFSAVDDSIGVLLKEKRVWRILRKLWLVFTIKTGLVRYAVLRDRRRAITEPYDAEVAYGDGFPYLYTAFGDSRKKISWSHSDVLVYDHSARYFRTMKTALARMDRHVAISEQVGEAYRTRYGVSDMQVIANLLNVDEIVEKAEEPTALPYDAEQLNFVTVGRLCHAKHYDMLIRTVKRLVENGRKCKTYIVGDGEDREELSALIESLGLSDTVFLLGRKDNPYPFVKQADVFLLSSRYEGLPTVLYEANILKTPCISTEVAGVYDILPEGCGAVCENSEDAFFEAVDRVFREPELLTQWNAALQTHAYDMEPTITKLKALFDLN